VYFRELGQRIQCIRAIYDKSSKKKYDKIVISFNKNNEPGPSVLTKLTAEEKIRLQNYLKKRKEAYLLTVVEQAPSKLAEIEYSLNTLNCLDEKNSKELWQALDRIARALKKAGYPKSKVKK